MLLEKYGNMSWEESCARRMDGKPMRSIIDFRGDVGHYLRFVTQAFSFLLEGCLFQHSMRKPRYAEVFAAARAFVRQGTLSSQTNYIEKMRPLLGGICLQQRKLWDRVVTLETEAQQLVKIMHPLSYVERVVQECFRETEHKIELAAPIRRRAVMESTHRRLGEESPLRSLPSDILRDIHGRFFESPGARDPWLELRWPV
jgi:hypothetical protein